MIPAGNGPSYDVHMSQQTREMLLQLHLQAAHLGKGNEFIAAFRQIIERLRKDPWVLGEPMYDLAALKLQIRKAVISPLVVDYGVHREKAFVFIRGFKVLT